MFDSSLGKDETHPEQWSLMNSAGHGGHKKFIYGMLVLYF
jgi:hypothetical protein